MKLSFTGLFLIGLLMFALTGFHSPRLRADTVQNQDDDGISLDDTATSEWKHKETPKPKTKDAKKEKKKSKAKAE